jgi:hypothetical protein
MVDLLLAVGSLLELTGSAARTRESGSFTACSLEVAATGGLIRSPRTPLR